MKKKDGQNAESAGIGAQGAADGQNVPGVAQGAILHDAYFNKPPRLIGLMLMRLALVCALSSFAVWSLTDLYRISDNQLFYCVFAAAVTAVLFMLLSLFPSSAVYAVIFGGGGVVCWILRDGLAERLSFFWDAAMMKLESRLLVTQPMFIHQYLRVKSGLFYKDELAEGAFLGLILLTALIALIFTVSARTRFYPFPVILTYAALAAPSFAAEICGFHVSIIAFASVFVALYTVGTGFDLDSRLVFGKPRAARDAVVNNEHSYRKRTRFFMLGKKLSSDLPRYFKYSANSFLALIVSAGVMLGAARAVPEGKGFDYKEIFDAVQEAGVSVADKVGGALGVTFGSVDDNGYFSYSSYGDDTGGIGISEPSKGNLPVMDVYLDRGDIPVYLRGDIGVSYNGSSWTAIRDDYGKFRDGAGVPYEEQLNGFYTDIQYQVLRQRLSSLGFNPDRLFPLQNVLINYRRSTKVVFQPLAAYEPDYLTNSDYDGYGDYVLRTDKGFIKSFNSLSLTPFMENTYMQEAVTAAHYSKDLDWTLPSGISNEQYSRYIAVYNDFVKQAYTASSPVISGLIEEMREEEYIDNGSSYVEGMSAYENAVGMCRYFRDNFTYSLDADNGKGSELLPSFLYRTKEGHCALFASAMVLAMRELGVPARYVTGYVTSGEGELTEDGRYLYTLRENDLHAWVEVYFENVGWLPFDPTAAVSGYAGAGAYEYDPFAPDETAEPDITEPPEETTAPEEYDPTETTLTDDAPTTAPPEEDEPAVSGDYDDDDDTDPGGTVTPPDPIEEKPDIFAAILPYLVTALIIAAVLAVLILFVKGVRRAEERALRGFRKKPPERAVAEMYRLVILLLTKEGIEPGAETLTDYAVRADASPLLKGANVFLTDVMPIFSKCEFGKPDISPVTEEERFAAYKFTNVLYHRVMDKKNVLSRFFTKISLFL